MKYFLLVSCISILLLTACSSEPETTVAPTQDVDVVVVKSDSVEITKDFVGQVSGISDIPIRARLDGFLEGIHFKEGHRVHKGQLLYTIDPEPYQAALAEAKSKLAGAEVELTNAENDYDRINPLADMHALSERDRDAAIANQGARKSAVEAAEANVQLSEIQLGYTKIYAPIEGLIGKTDAKIGEYVGKPPNPVILNTVSRIDSVQVQFFITESDFLQSARAVESGKVKSGALMDTPIQLVLSDGSIYRHRGKIDFIDREINPITGTILIQGTFPNHEGLIRPGQFGKVRVVTNKSDSGILIPQRCVTEFQGMNNVMVLKSDSTVAQRQVEIFAPYHDYYLLSSGLEPGDKIVIEGLQKIKDGMKVHAETVEFKSKQAGE